MAKISHHSVKNPENFPSILMPKLVDILQRFEQEYDDDITKGCVRNYCSIPAHKLVDFLKKNGFNKAKLKRGGFLVDDPRPLSLQDFTDEEKALAKEQGFMLRFPEKAEEFAEKNNLWDKLKVIPHYWTAIGDLIIDFTADAQFVKSSMSSDTNPNRYKNKILEQALTEVGDNPYDYSWQPNEEDGKYEGSFLTDKKLRINYIVYLHKPLTDSWMVEFTYGHSYKLTGQGDAYRILATITKMTEQFIKEQQPRLVKILADKDEAAKDERSSRMKLYDKGLVRLANKLNYKITKYDDEDFVYYNLERNFDKKQINEVGDSSYNFKVTENVLAGFRAEFNTDEDIKVTFMAVTPEYPFGTDESLKLPWDVAWDADGDIGLSGKGDQFKILSTVMKIFNLFIKGKNPQQITFTADKVKDISSGDRKNTRTKIYKRAMDILANKHGYSIKIVDQNYMDKFILTKVEK